MPRCRKPLDHAARAEINPEQQLSRLMDTLSRAVESGPF